MYEKIFLTGSNAKMLSKEIATALRGRSFSFEIMPLSFSKFLSFQNIDSEDIYSWVLAERMINPKLSFLDKKPFTVLQVSDRLLRYGPF
jgi:hypothetical protein